MIYFLSRVISVNLMYNFRGVSLELWSIYTKILIIIFLMYQTFIAAYTYDSSGEKVAYNQLAAFVVGAGNFGGPKQSNKIKEFQNPPARSPDHSFVDKTLIDQVLEIYFGYVHFVQKNNAAITHSGRYQQWS